MPERLPATTVEGRTSTPLIIFGVGTLAERARFYLERYSDHKVVGFTVERNFMSVGRFLGLPVVAFEDVAVVFPAADNDFFCAVGYKDYNATRLRICSAAKKMGYELVSCAAPSAVLNDVSPAGNTLIMDNANIGPFCSIGEGLILSTGSVISHHSTVGDHCYVSANVTLAGHCLIGDRVFFGAGSVLADHIEIPAGTFVGMGSVVTKTIRKPGVYAGNPARLIRTVVQN